MAVCSEEVQPPEKASDWPIVGAFSASIALRSTTGASRQTAAELEPPSPLPGGEIRRVVEQLGAEGDHVLAAVLHLVVAGQLGAAAQRLAGLEGDQVLRTGGGALDQHADVADGLAVAGDVEETGVEPGARRLPARNPDRVRAVVGQHDRGGDVVVRPEPALVERDARRDGGRSGAGGEEQDDGEGESDEEPGSAHGRPPSGKRAGRSMAAGTTAGVAVSNDTRCCRNPAPEAERCQLTRSSCGTRGSRRAPAPSRWRRAPRRAPRGRGSSPRAGRCRGRWR